MESYHCMNSRVMEFLMFLNSPGSVCGTALVRCCCHLFVGRQRVVDILTPWLSARISFLICRSHQKLLNIDLMLTQRPAIAFGSSIKVI